MWSWMRMTVLTVGSRGDVQPFLALGLGLERAGHRVRVATHPKFEPLVAGAGLEFAPLAEGRLSAGDATADGRRWIEAGSRRLPGWVGFLRDARSVARRRLSDAISACQGADALLASDLATLLGWQMSAHYGTPLVRAKLNLPGPLSERASGRLAAVARQAAWATARPWLDRVRRDVGLPPLPRREPLAEADRRGDPSLGAFSPRLGSAPARSERPLVATGFWFLDRDLDPDPPPALLEFLADGPAPVAVGFGSMIDADAARTTELAVEALRLAGRRGILIRGAYGMPGEALPETVIALDTVSHTWLFPRCAAIVHHAAAGTMAAALRAGRPSVPVPHMSNQSRWARRTRELGVSTTAIQRRRLTAPRLADAIAAATSDRAMSDRSARLGELIRAEDGVGQAVTALERSLNEFDHQEVPSR
jgi:sterol 3beta-glucosyltransferase